MKKALLILTALVIVLVGSISCTTTNGPNDSQFVAGMELKADKTRVTSDASRADLETLVEGNTTFAFDLYQQLAGENEGNLFFSPYSISIALAMTYAGARGETERQMAEVLHFDLPQDSLHAAFNLLEAELDSRQSLDEESYFKLDITNAIWGQQGFDFLQNFLDTLAENYGAGLRIADFLHANEEARQVINQWAREETEGRIEELIAPGELDPGTVLVLANAIYFKALWFSPFHQEQTKDGQFNLLDGSTITLPMMFQSMQFNYTEGSDYQAVELTYKGHDFSMVVLLPREGKFGDFEASLDAQKVSAIIDRLEAAVVDLSMPRFSYETGYDLRGTLSDMGMPNAFGPGANFSGMAANAAGLYIIDAAHKAFISVDEEGTEAAAASWVAVGGMSNYEFTMDRPFIYLIRDRETGTILFIGRVLNPSL
jgi:serpin B